MRRTGAVVLALLALPVVGCSAADVGQQGLVTPPAPTEQTPAQQMPTPLRPGAKAHAAGRQHVVPGQTLPAAPCVDQTAGAFAPASISIPGVTSAATVLAIPYDARGVPGTPPVTTAGKTVFAWEPDVHPGAIAGNVLLNAHTWPDGTALGNHLLAGLQPGGRIVVHGSRGQELCYRVTGRTEVDADASVPEYFATHGPPQLAIIVCSGTRLGPGNWTKRTIWYAAPDA
jgi:hypothetical protein